MAEQQREAEVKRLEEQRRELEENQEREIEHEESTTPSNKFELGEMV